MPINNGMMSTNSNEWGTPQAFFDALDYEFNFTLDVAATVSNTKCKRFYTEEDNALYKPWTGIVWCNPPYGRIIGKFVEKAYEESQSGATVVMLIPARTDTTYWHDYVMRSKQIRFIRGRLYFEQGGINGPAPFPSAIIVFEPGEDNFPTVSSYRWQ